MTEAPYQSERSPDARRRAETALVRLAHAHEAEPPRLVLLGGLVPALLAGPTAPAHLGTADVDLLVVLHVAEPTDSSPLERALERAGFEPDPKSDGWRWRVVVDRVGVKVEFLCDDETIRDSNGRRRAVVSLAGCRTLTAANLDGTRFVAFDTGTRTITAPLIDGTHATVEIEHACLEGYLLAKLYSARHRGYEKDYYDLVYVLLTSPDGPSGAARTLAKWIHTPSPAGLATMLAEIEARFATDDAPGTRGYAGQSRLANPLVDAHAERLDARAAIGEFISALRGAQTS